VRVPESAQLRCMAELGPVSFEARVLDISTEGLGTILYDPAIRIEPGTRLDGARVVLPGREPMAVDLVVRQVKRQPQEDGSYAMRAGCSISAQSADIDRLVDFFVVPIE
jgi:hypothetical protein